MSTNRIAITKLAPNSSNWVMYRDPMTLMFRSRQWSNHFTSITVPQSYINAGDINGQTPDQHWALEEDMAIGLIANTMPDQIFNRVKSNTTTMGMWDTIKAIYQTRSKMATIDLTQKSQSTKLQNEGDTHTHLSHLMDLREQLTALGKTLDDDEFTSTLLSSLPSSYRSVIHSINAAADQMGTPVTPNRVIQLVTNKYDNRTRNQGKNGPDEAFAANGQKRRDMRNIECYNCHKMGHFKLDCLAPGGGKEDQHLPRRNNNATSTDSCNNRGRSDRSDNRNNRGRNSNHNNNHNENANTANTTAAKPADIEAWAAIKEINEDTPDSTTFNNAYSTNHPLN